MSEWEAYHLKKWRALRSKRIVPTTFCRHCVLPPTNGYASPTSRNHVSKLGHLGCIRRIILGHHRHHRHHHHHCARYAQWCESTKAEKSTAVDEATGKIEAWALIPHAWGWWQGKTTKLWETLTGWTAGDHIGKPLSTGTAMVKCHGLFPFQG